jgi:hypothetical protein
VRFLDKRNYWLPEKVKEAVWQGTISDWALPMNRNWSASWYKPISSDHHRISFCGLVRKLKSTACLFSIRKWPILLKFSDKQENNHEKFPSNLLAIQWKSPRVYGCQWAVDIVRNITFGKGEGGYFIKKQRKETSKSSTYSRWGIIAVLDLSVLPLKNITEWVI